MPEHDVHQPGVSASAAFRYLPEERPQRDAWPRLAQRLQHRRHPRRLRWLLAAAAVLALGLLLPRPFLPTSDSPPPQLTDALPASSELDTLKRTSAQLEALLRELGNEREDAGVAMLHARLLDELAGIDALLASSPASPEIERWLWSERVLRLQRLTGLGAHAGLLAAQEPAVSDVPTIY
jgi:hypothetical protein